MCHPGHTVGLASACAILVLLVSSSVLAQRIVLVRPAEEQVLLSEVFNRLQGELRMRGFEPIPATAAGLVTFAEMQAITDAAAAEACVAFESKEGLPTVHLWFVDKQSELKQSLSFSGPDDSDSAVVLPLRTVELLRSAALVRREFADATSRPPAAPPVPRPMVPRQKSAERRLSPAPRLYSVRASAGAEWGSVTRAPSLSVDSAVAVRILPDWTVGVTVVLPFKDAEVAVERATARYSMVHALAELSFRHWLVSERLWLAPAWGLGATCVRATAEVDEPLAALHDSGWVANLSFSTGLWTRVLTRGFVGAQARAGIVFPKPVVDVSGSRFTLGRPVVSVGMGAGIEF